VQCDCFCFNQITKSYRAKLKLMAAPLEKLEQIALEFDVLAKPGYETYKTEAEDKIATMKECKKELAKGVLQAEKYLETGVFLPAKGVNCTFRLSGTVPR
jgi:hypothetical protein